MVAELLVCSVMKKLKCFSKMRIELRKKEIGFTTKFQKLQSIFLENFLAI